MYITAFFSDCGTPQSGLSPTIDIEEIGVGIVVNGAAMTAGTTIGWYYYNFTTYDKTKNYLIRCDGGATLSDLDRYKTATNEDNELEVEHDVTQMTLATMEGKIDIVDTNVDKIVVDVQGSGSERVAHDSVGGSGAVLDAYSDPVQDMEVTAYLSTDTNKSNPLARTMTDVNGGWELFLDPGTYTLVFYKPNYAGVEETRTVS